MRWPGSEHRVRSAAWAVLAIAIVARALAATLVPLAPDETYYWEWSRRLAAGYLDHPFGIALVTRLGTAIFGATTFGVRAASLLAGAAASVVIVRISGSLGGARAMLRAAAIIACMPLAQLGLALATPDATLLLFWALALAALVAALRDASPARRRTIAWALAGLTIGAALSTKYTAILLAAGAAVSLSVQPRLRRVFCTPGPYLAVALALCVFAPNLAWNAQHGWASFAWQLGHGLTAHRGTAAQHEARMLGGQLGLVSPLLFVVLAAAVWHSLRDRDDPVRTMLAVIAAIAWLAFAASALRAAVEPNWQAPAYLSAIVLAAARGRKGSARTLFRAALALGGAATLLIYAHAIAPFVPIDPSIDPTGAGFGWSALAARVDSARQLTPRGAIAWVAGERYQEASELAFHLSDHPTTFAIDVHGRPNQYDQWPAFAQRAHAGDRLVLVLGLFTEPANDPVIAALAPHFDRVALREVVQLKRGLMVRASRRIWVLDGWHGSWPRTGLSRDCRACDASAPFGNFP